MEFSDRKKILNSKSIKSKSGSRTETKRREDSILKRIKRESRITGKKIADEAYQEFLRRRNRNIDVLIKEMEEKYKRLISGQATHTEKLMIFKMREMIDAFTERCLSILDTFSHNKKN